MTDVGRLFDDVELAERVQLRRAEHGLDDDGVLVVHVAHMTQPIIDQAYITAFERGLHATATVVPTDDDVLNFQDVHRVLQDRETIQVGVDDDVGDVAMHEELARQQADNLVGGDAAIGAADPEVTGILLLGQGLEESGVLATNALRPFAVFPEQVFDGRHRRDFHWEMPWASKRIGQFRLLGRHDGCYRLSFRTCYGAKNGGLSAFTTSSGCLLRLPSGRGLKLRPARGVLSIT